VIAVFLLGGYLALVTWHGLGAGYSEDDSFWVFAAQFVPNPYFGRPRAAEGERRWEVCVPSLYRWYTISIVELTGADTAAVPPSKDPDRGRRESPGYVPPATRDLFRSANIALFALTLVLLFWIAQRTLDSTALAAATIVPIAGSMTFWDSVAWRIGPDALLCFLLVAVLAAWLMLDTAKWRGLVVVSILCGLAASSKQNGILVLAAWCGYLAAKGKGVGRIWRPITAVLIAAGVFCAINPATWHGPLGFLRGSIWIRQVITTEFANAYGPHTWWQFLNDALPTWPLVPVYAWLLWRCRRERWLAPVAWWGGFLAIGTLVTIPSPVTRYLAPLEMGLYFPAMLCALHLVSRRGRGSKESGGAG
jgi:hypothetical protein